MRLFSPFARGIGESLIFKGFSLYFNFLIRVCRYNLEVEVIA